MPDKIAKLHLDDDSAAMKRLAAGDESALADIIARHQKTVFNLAYRFFPDHSFAQDIAQEAFLRIYSHSKRYKPAARFTTYLYRIVTNLCLSELRSQRLRKASSLSDTVVTGEGELVREVGAISHRDPLEKSELVGKVRQAIQSLPPNQRIATILSRYEEMSYAEIAKVMSVSVMAVKSLLSRARERIRERLLPYLQAKG